MPHSPSFRRRDASPSTKRGNANHMDKTDSPNGEPRKDEKVIRDRYYRGRVKKRPRYNSRSRRGARYRYRASSSSETSSDDDSSGYSSRRAYYSDESDYSRGREHYSRTYQERYADRCDSEDGTEDRYNRRRRRNSRGDDERRYNQHATYERDEYGRDRYKRDNYDRDKYGRSDYDQAKYQRNEYDRDRYRRDRYKRDRYEYERQKRHKYNYERYDRDRDDHRRYDRSHGDLDDDRHEYHRDRYDRDRYDRHRKERDQQYRDRRERDRHEDDRHDSSRHHRDRHYHDGCDNDRLDDDRYDSALDDRDRHRIEESHNMRQSSSRHRRDSKLRGRCNGDRESRRRKEPRKEKSPLETQHNRGKEQIRVVSPATNADQDAERAGPRTPDAQMLKQHGNKKDGTGDNPAENPSPSVEKPTGKKETFWQRRRRLRESAPSSPIWDTSPPPPRRLEDRFEVGADERKKKEMKRQRKEERRARREDKRIRKAAKEAETEASQEPEVPAPSQESKQLNSAPEQKPDSDEEAAVLGPSLPPTKEKSKLDYGKALRPGEGTKMAAFVQDGTRIPRRGEIGLTSEQISSFEEHGYVMSGSRNRRMEAVRIRKENQVYSAEELAALSQFSREERKAREEQMMNHFRTLVESKHGEKASLPARVDKAGNAEDR